MATSSDAFAGSPTPYHFIGIDTALANSGTIVITHSADPKGIRRVTVINNASGAILSPAASVVSVVHTSDTTTTITNLTGSSANLKVVVTVQP